MEPQTLYPAEVVTQVVYQQQTDGTLQGFRTVTVIWSDVDGNVVAFGTPVTETVDVPTGTVGKIESDESVKPTKP
jgi:hypothetical protein